MSIQEQPDINFIYKERQLLNSQGRPASIYRILNFIRASILYNTYANDDVAGQGLTIRSLNPQTNDEIQQQFREWINR